MRDRQQVTIYIEGTIKNLYSSICHKSNMTEAAMGRVLVIKFLDNCGVLTPQLKDAILAEFEGKGIDLANV